MNPCQLVVPHQKLYRPRAKGLVPTSKAVRSYGLKGLMTTGGHGGQDLPFFNKLYPAATPQTLVGTEVANRKFDKREGNVSKLVHIL